MPFLNEDQVIHPAVKDVLQWFKSDHLPSHLQEVSKKFEELAHWLAENGRGSQVTPALHDLLSAKDKAVRSVIQSRSDSQSPS
jgi:hypothetical protein